MSTLAEKSIDFLNRFPSIASVAEQFGKSEKVVRSWTAKGGKPPIEVAELLMSGFNPETDAPGATQTAPPETEALTLPEGEDEIDQRGDSPGDDVTTEDDIYGKLEDLHQRLQFLEDLDLPSVMATIDAELFELRNVSAGRIPPSASRLRPGGRAPVTSFDPNQANRPAPPSGFGARRVPPPAYAGGSVAQGRAPTREQAHLTARAPRGNPERFQPQQQEAPQPPRLNRARSVSADWNMSKARRMQLQAKARRDAGLA